MLKDVEKRSSRATRQHYDKPCRDKVVKIRMSAEELTMLDEKRGTSSRSNFLRRPIYRQNGSSTGKRVTLDVPLLERTLMELKRIGINNNQIARAYNSRFKHMDMLQEIRAKMTVKSDEEAFERFRKSIDKILEEIERLRIDLQNYVEYGGDF